MPPRNRRTRALRVIVSWLAAAGVVAVGAACATARVYDGPTRDPSQVSLLKLDNDRASVAIKSIDDRTLKARQIEMLPGAHTARVRVKYAQHFSSGFVGTQYAIKMECQVDFETAAGRTYVMRPFVALHDEGFLTESITLGVQVEDAEQPGRDIATHACGM